MSFEVFIPYKDNGFEGVLLNCYKESYSIIQAGKTPNGDVYMQWCFPKKKDGEPTDRPLPMMVNLGNEYDAKRFLKKLLAVFEKGEVPDGHIMSPGSDEIPF